MPRSPRADATGGLHHALNRGNLRADNFKKDDDFSAFEKILSEVLERIEVELYSNQLMSNHYHLVQCPQVDGEMSRFMGWVGGHSFGTLLSTSGVTPRRAQQATGTDGKSSVVPTVAPMVAPIFRPFCNIQDNSGQQRWFGGRVNPRGNSTKTAVSVEY